MKIKITVLYGILLSVIVVTVYVWPQILQRQLSSMQEEYPYSQLPGPASEAAQEEGAPDINSLLDINEDFKGWLHIPNTVISLPVVQGEDNDFYLEHSFYRNKSIYGCLFFDTRSREGGGNRVIHGHNMGQNREEMFSPLVLYQQQAYASSHKYVFFTDRSGRVSAYEVFAVVNLDTSHPDSLDYRTSSFANREEFASFVSCLQENSVYKSEFAPASEDVLILSTCNRKYGKANRLLICCGKIR